MADPTTRKGYDTILNDHWSIGKIKHHINKEGYKKHAAFWRVYCTFCSFIVMGAKFSKNNKRIIELFRSKQESEYKWSFNDEQIEYLQQFWKESSNKEKLRFLFDLCDLNSNMLVEKSELSTVLHAVFEYCGVDDMDHLKEIDDIEGIEKFWHEIWNFDKLFRLWSFYLFCTVAEIFEHKDTNKDDLLTEEEFITSNEIDVKLFQKFEVLVDFKH